MKKLKLLTIVLFILGAGGAAMTAEVINIDLNGHGDDTPYVGNGAYDVGKSTWNVYYGDWGKPMGSDRSDMLADFDEPCQPGIYAAQVWIGDPGTGHGYKAGSGLMDDGFVANPSVEPNISLFGQDAYTGTFDIYVYGANDGTFTVKSPTYDSTKDVNGVAPPGEFVLGGNYVVFPTVRIDDTNTVKLSYTNELNGLQLVKLKQPVAIHSVTDINAPNYDVAFDTNHREGEEQHFGPDGNDTRVVYIDNGEYMEYDITVDEANEGRYDVNAWVNTFYDRCRNLNVYLDDIWLGLLIYEDDSTAYPPDYDIEPTSSVSVNLFKGSHTFKWAHIGYNYGYDISHFRFTRTGEVIMNDCNDVYTYGLNYTGDLNGDCRVDYNDLTLIIDNWLINYDPNNS